MGPPTATVQKPHRAAVTSLQALPAANCARADPTAPRGPTHALVTRSHQAATGSETGTHLSTQHRTPKTTNTPTGERSSHWQGVWWGDRGLHTWGVLRCSQRGRDSTRHIEKLSHPNTSIHSQFQNSPNVETKRNEHCTPVHTPQTYSIAPGPGITTPTGVISSQTQEMLPFSLGWRQADCPWPSSQHPRPQSDSQLLPTPCPNGVHRTEV